MICNRCGEDRKHKAHGLCTKCYAKTQYDENREYRLAYARTYYALHPEKHYQSRLMVRFNLSPEDYIELLESQGGVCAICGMTPEENGRRLCIDHSHDDTKVRGLLCNNCNYGVSRFRDDPELMEIAKQYLLRWKNS